MTVNKDDKRIVIETGFIGDELIVAISDDQLRITIAEPRAGDTETGFGQSAGTYLSPEAAIELGTWLIQAGKAIGKGRSS
ncbi:hypothetical protein H7Q97_14005 [Ochrobactrum sp. CM-21-5]|nr:hypothetical protein [Ochrobactrum sp. CM-21-5]MBC2886505.1 hypothetical protein [Ochrobactrum sp. CM-21-5]